MRQVGMYEKFSVPLYHSWFVRTKSFTFRVYVVLEGRFLPGTELKVVASL